MYLGPIFLDTIVEYVIMVVEAKESSGNETSRIPLFGPLNVEGNSTALKVSLGLILQLRNTY